ncbi:MAG: PorT family protein [Prevotella sp.]|nr:PorT family protein [Prevotella sp.]
MKKVMILAVMMVATLTASAQQAVGTWSVTPKVGLNLATIRDGGIDAKMKVGLVAGADLTYQIAQPFALSVGAFYSMQGAKGKDREFGVSYDAKLNLDYINIPIMANVYIVRGLAIKAGIQPGFNVKHKMKVEGAGQSYEQTIEGFKSFDFTIPLGLSYEISDFVIDARYNLGLTKLVEDTSGKNSVIQFTLGYKIPL